MTVTLVSSEGSRAKARAASVSLPQALILKYGSNVFLKETTTPVDVHDVAERWKSHGAMQGTSPTLWVRSVEVGKRKGVEFVDEDQ